MLLQPPEKELPELGVATAPEILDLQVDDRPVHLPEAHLDERAVLVLGLVHHEDAVCPVEIVPRELPGGEARHPTGADLVSLVVAIEVLRGLASVHVGRADEQDALSSRARLLPPDCTRSRWYTHADSASRMDIDRLLHDVEGHLSGLDEGQRQEVTEALREAIARERRHLGPGLTVEAERERRRTAEEMRQALEAIHRPTRLDQALEEVLTQLGRVVTLDYAAVAAREPGEAFRVLAARGAEDEPSGAVVTNPRLDEVRTSHRPVIVADAQTAGVTQPLPGSPPLSTWAALPLLLEGDVVGLLLAGRLGPPSFSEEEILRGKAVAFWAAAGLRRGLLLEQVRRYAAMLEQVVTVDQRVFDGASSEEIVQDVLLGACRVGGYAGGLLVLQTPRGPVVAATSGEGFGGAASRPAPADLAVTTPRRLPPERMLEVAEALGTELPAGQTYLVPLATPDAYVGCLVLPDPNGESPDDRLIEAYASRAAAAWRHADLHHDRS